jgi:hypothetical protein
MIRPFTLISAVLAVLSGLYLYHAKNASLMLDRKIERIARDTVTVAEQTRLLHAEWTLLNDPERLRQYADLYLALKPLAPTQFTALADLPARMPSPVAPSAEAEPGPAQTGDGPAGLPPSEERDATIVAEEVLPLPPLLVPPPPITASRPALPLQLAATAPSATPVQAAAPRPPAEAPVVRPPLQAQTPMPADARSATRPPDGRPGDPRPADPRPADPRAADPRSAEVRLAAARPPVQAVPLPAPVTRTAAPSAPPVSRPVASSIPVAAATYQPVATGSLLGSAPRGAPAPLPRPTPYAPMSQDGGG